jgi:hypothetical protein
LQEVEEIKTVQVFRTMNVTLLPQAWPGNFLRFSADRGLASWHGHASSDPDTWEDYRVGVESSISGKLRTSTNITGRPQVCSPDASINGVSQCTE